MKKMKRRVNYYSCPACSQEFQPAGLMQEGRKQRWKMTVEKGL